MIKITDISTARICIGYEGEQNHAQFAFDCSEVFGEYPEAYAQMAIRPPQGNIYPKVMTRDGNCVIWNVGAADCAVPGNGEYQITFTNGSTVVKSYIGFFAVRDSLVANGEAPEPVEDWLEQVEAALAAFDGLTASAETLPAGSAATAEVTMVNGHKNVAFGIPAGEQGEQGEPGEDGAPGQDGFSPVVTVTDIPGGHRVSITDASGTKTFDVKDGENGAPGQDGVSPTVTVTDIAGGHTVTITDATGDHSFNVMNGAQGEPGDPTELIDDSSTTATNRTWSANKLATEKLALYESIVQSQTDIANLQKNKAPIIIDTVSGSVASFPDGADGLPVQNLVVNIEPVQSGTGDPSPSNIRPISGWPGANVYRSDDAVYDKNVDAIQQGSIVGTTGNQTSSDVRIRTTYLGVKPSTTYTINCNLPYCYIHEYSTDNMSGYITNSGGWLSTPCSYTTSATGKCLRIVIAKATSAGGAGSIEVSPSDLEYLTILENGVSVTIPVSWQSEAGTVYGGNYNVTTGLLTVTHGQIASYNGETLPGEWISDRDVYAEGTTPTTGAQVVYELADPLTYQLTGTQINTLLGNNCIWADTGDSAVTYRADTELFVRKSVPVQDVQINGVSVLSQGVASISQPKTETVTGSTPSITAVADTRYLCGECATLSLTPCVTGDCEVIFTSGSTATVLTLPNTVKLPAWFDATSLEANTVYDILITNGVYGMVMSWAA